MKEYFDNLIKQTEEMRDAWLKTEEEAYRRGPHKTFLVGDYVKKGLEYGRVEWLSNKAIGIKEDCGYFGLDILSGNMGFRAPCRLDEYVALSEQELCYLESDHEITITLTGEQVERLRYDISSRNHSGPQDKLSEAIKKIRPDSLDAPA